jgi:hypothetical protein
MTTWVFTSRAVSDWGYVFFEKAFDDEAAARAEFASAKAHATEHGGAGSLHHFHDGTTDVIDRFSIWCPND